MQSQVRILIVTFLSLIIIACNGGGSSTTSGQTTYGAISLSESTVNVSAGFTSNLVLTLSNSQNVSDLSVAITSSNTDIATVEPSSCTLSTSSNTCDLAVTGVESGNTTLLATPTSSHYSVESASIVVAGISESSPPRLSIAVSSGETSGVCAYPYDNAPCVSVTICEPGSVSNCSTVNNVILDTGSYGLRIFGSSISSSVLNALPYMQSDGNQVGECVTYGGGDANWGVIQYADVKLGLPAQTASNIPIQIINSNYGSLSGLCNVSNVVTSPSDFGGDGIMGVGPALSDQGWGRYYSCGSSGASCGSVSITPPSYVPNPVASLGEGYNNGEVLVFPAISDNGQTVVNGYMAFGVSTNESNTPNESANVFRINTGSNTGIFNINTNIWGTDNNSFIDSGSNFLNFVSTTGVFPSLPYCSGSSGFLCPTSTLAESAVLSDIFGHSSNLSFALGNANTLFNTGNTAFSNIGVGSSGSFGMVDWGLPFFYGKSVYVVFPGESVTVGGTTYPASDDGYWIYQIND